MLCQSEFMGIPEYLLGDQGHDRHPFLMTAKCDPGQLGARHTSEPLQLLRRSVPIFPKRKLFRNYNSVCFVLSTLRTQEGDMSLKVAL